MNDSDREEVNKMPGYDGTGPAGMGPMTGGARGRCDPYGAYDPYGSPYSSHRSYPSAYGLGRPRRGIGRGFFGRGGRGQGRGRGRGRR